MDSLLLSRVPEPVLEVARLLHEAGYDAVLVGGAVRDALLGIPSADWDLVTDADTAELRQLITSTPSVRSIYDVGERFGTLGLALHGTGEHPVGNLEISRYRPDALGAPMIEKRFAIDGSHRDFTINAIGLDLASGELLDPLGGRADLAQGVLRAPADPRERLAEDPLRAIRAARFAAELGVALEVATRDALPDAAPLLERVAPERIRAELTRLLVADNVAAGLHVLHESGALAVVLPEVAALDGVGQPSFHDLDVLAHTIQTVELSPATPVMRWAALLHDVAKAPTRSVEPDGRIRFFGHAQEGARIAAHITERLRFSAADTRAIVHLVATHMRLGELDPTNPRAVDRAVRALDLHTDNPDQPLLVRAEDAVALTLADFGATAHRADAPAVRTVLETAIAASRARGTHQPVLSPVSGAEIMEALGLAAGPEIGAAKRAITGAIESGALAPENREGALVVAAAALGITLGASGGAAFTGAPFDDDEPLHDEARYRMRRIFMGVVSLVLIIALVLLLVIGNVWRKVPRARPAPPAPVYSVAAPKPQPSRTLLGQS